MNKKENAMNLTAKKTSELRRFDVVREHGMRVLLDRDPIQMTAGTIATHMTGNPHGYSWSGRVLNVDEITDSFILYFVREEGRWSIQGNDLVTWAVEDPYDCEHDEHDVRTSAQRCDKCGADLCDICGTSTHRTSEGHDLNDPRYWGV